MTNGGESAQNAFLMRENCVDEDSSPTAMYSSLLNQKFFSQTYTHTHVVIGKNVTLLMSWFSQKAKRIFIVCWTDWPTEAGAVKERVGAAGSANKAGDPQQPELGLQTAYRSAQRVSHCQRATCCHSPNRGSTKKSLTCLPTKQNTNIPISSSGNFKMKHETFHAGDSRCTLYRVRTCYTKK